MNSNNDDDNDDIGLVKIKKSYSVRFGVDVNRKEKEEHNDCIVQDRTRSKSHISFTYTPLSLTVITVISYFSLSILAIISVNTFSAPPPAKLSIKNSIFFICIFLSYKLLTHNFI